MAAVAADQRPCVDEVGGQDQAGGELGVHGGDVDERVPVVEGVEFLLVGRLDAVVEFVADPVAYFFHHHFRVEPGRPGAEQGQSGFDDRGQQVGVGQIGSYRVGHAGILHFDGQFGAVGQPGQVDLADGGGRDGPGREEGEDLFGGRPQLGVDDRGDLVGSEWGHVSLEAGQGRLEQLAGGSGDHAVDVDKREDLAHFHDRPLHVAQHFGVAAGEPLLAGPFRGLGCLAASATVHPGLGSGGHGVPGQSGQANRAPGPSGRQLGVRHGRYAAVSPAGVVTFACWCSGVSRN